MKNQEIKYNGICILTINYKIKYHSPYNKATMVNMF